MYICIVTYLYSVNTYLSVPSDIDMDVPRCKAPPPPPPQKVLPPALPARERRTPHFRSSDRSSIPITTITSPTDFAFTHQCKQTSAPTRWRTARPLLTSQLLPSPPPTHSTWRAPQHHPLLRTAPSLIAPVHRVHTPPHTSSHSSSLNVSETRTVASLHDSRLQPERATSEPFEALRRERARNVHNDYVDGPTLAAFAAKQHAPKHAPPPQHVIDSDGRVTNLCSGYDPDDSVCTSEPTSCSDTFKKAAPKPHHAPDTPIPGTREYHPHLIPCRDCGLCRCNACRAIYYTSEQRCCGLPVEELVDDLSCLCAVKACLYHCNGDDSCQKLYVDEPCTCTGSTRSQIRRWTCMAVASVTCLPCLWAYWPLRGVVKIATSLCGPDPCFRPTRHCSCPSHVPHLHRELLGES